MRCTAARSMRSLSLAVRGLLPATHRCDPSCVPIMLKGVRYLLTTLLAVALTACGSPPPPAAALPEDLPASLQKFISPLHGAVQRQPDSYRHRITLARSYAVHSHWDQAVAEFQAATQLDPDQPLPWFHWALAEQQRGANEEATQLFVQTAERFPQFAPNLDRLGAWELDSGELDAADHRFTELRRLLPSHPNGHLGGAQVKLALKQLPEALRHAESALAMAPNDRHAHYVYGLVQRAMGDLERAQIHLQRGAGAQRSFIPDAWQEDNWRLAHTPTAAIAYARLASAAGKLDQALELAQRVLSWDSANLDALNIVAVVHIARNQPRDACLTLAPTLQTDPRHLDSRLNLASCYGAMGSTGAALQHADIALEIQANSAKAHHLKAKALLGSRRSTDLDAAIESLEQSLQLAPYDADAQRDLAFAKLNKGDLDAAQTLFKAIAVADPKAPWGPLGLGEVAIRQGQVAQARSELAKAKAVAPDHPGVSSLQSRIDALTQQ